MTSNDTEKFVPVFKEAAKIFKGKVYFLTYASILHTVIAFFIYSLDKFYILLMLSAESSDISNLIFLSVVHSYIFLKIVPFII